MVNSARIKKRMRELKFNQNDVAKALGVKQVTVSQKINNVRPMKLQEAEKLAKLLGIRDFEFASFFFS